MANLLNRLKTIRYHAPTRADRVANRHKTSAHRKSGIDFEFSIDRAMAESIARAPPAATSINL
jgi:hypothetical protein